MKPFSKKAPVASGNSPRPGRAVRWRKKNSPASSPARGRRHAPSPETRRYSPHFASRILTWLFGSRGFPSGTAANSSPERDGRCRNPAPRPSRTQSQSSPRSACGCETGRYGSALPGGAGQFGDVVDQRVRGRGIETAEHAFREASEIEPNRTSALVPLSNAIFALGRRRADFCVQVGHPLMNAGAPSAAVDAYRQAPIASIASARMPISSSAPYRRRWRPCPSPRRHSNHPVSGKPGPVHLPSRQLPHMFAICSI